MGCTRRAGSALPRIQKHPVVETAIVRPRRYSQSTNKLSRHRPAHTNPQVSTATRRGLADNMSDRQPTQNLRKGLAIIHRPLSGIVAIFGIKVETQQAETPAGIRQPDTPRRQGGGRTEAIEPRIRIRV